MTLCIVDGYGPLVPLRAAAALMLTVPVNLSVDGLPNTVPSTAPVYNNGVVSGARGSLHQIPLGPDNTLCVAGGSGHTTGTVYLQIHSPHNVSTLLPISLSDPSL